MADGKRRGDTPLDATSKQIIAQLQQNGRRPYATIGKEVGLSEAAVRQRVHKLLEQGRIQIVAVADPAEVGFARQAMLGITANRDLRPIADRLAKMDEVSYVAVTAGSFDLLAEVMPRATTRFSISSRARSGQFQACDPPRRSSTCTSARSPIPGECAEHGQVPVSHAVAVAGDGGRRLGAMPYASWRPRRRRGGRGRRLHGSVDGVLPRSIPAGRACRGRGQRGGGLRRVGPQRRLVLGAVPAVDGVARRAVCDAR
jgi:Lrp/AsnC family transcriptional regulator for asnA, asnC and gidA